MSKSLINFLDNALLPASIMVFGKFVGIFLTLKFFNLPYSVAQVTNSFLSTSTFLKEADVQLVVSYSDLVMFLFLAVGFSINVFRAVYLHSSHVKPALVARLANHNLLRVIRSSYDIYHAASVWLIFMWVGTMIIIVNVLTQQTFAWIGIVSLIISVVLTIVLLQDVYKEMENIKNKPGDYEWI